MSFAVGLLALLGASPEPLKIAAPGLTGVGVEPAKSAFYTEHLAQQLTFSGVRVITSKEIGSLLGMERQRQLLGCGEDSTSCLAELANAMGTDGVLLGDVAKVEGVGFQLNLKIIAARDGRPLAAYSAKAETEAALLEALAQGARAMSAELYQGLGRQQPRAVGAAPSTNLRRLAWAPAAVGVVAGVIGGVLLQQAGTRYQLLTTHPEQRISVETAQDARDQGRMFQTTGAVLLGVGIAFVVAAVALFLFGAP